MNNFKLFVTLFALLALLLPPFVTAGPVVPPPPTPAAADRQEVEGLRKEIGDLRNQIDILKAVQEERKGPARLSDERLLDLEQMKEEMATLNGVVDKQSQRLSDLLTYGSIILALILGVAGLFTWRTYEAERTSKEATSEVKTTLKEAKELVEQIRGHKDTAESDLKEIASKKSETFGEPERKGDEILQTIQEKGFLESQKPLDKAIGTVLEEYGGFSGKEADERGARPDKEKDVSQDEVRKRIESLEGFKKLAESAGKELPASHYFNLAYDLVASGEHEKALQQYTRAIDLKPDYAGAYNNRGNLYAKLNEPEKARADYDKAIELKPDYAGAYNNRGSLYHEKLNEPEKARADYDKAIELKPDYALAYNNRGSLYHEKLNEPEKARADYDKAIELKPDFANAYYNRGNLYVKLNKPEKARADYDKAIELKPDYATAYNNRGSLYHEKLNEPEKACADYDKAIELKPDDANAYYNRGSLYHEKLNEPEKARADYDKAIELKPDDATAHYNRGLLYAKLNDPEKARADYDKAIELKPDDASAYNNRGNLYDDLNDPEKARADYDKAIELKPDYANAYNNRGSLYAKLNDPEKARADYDKAIELKPDDATAYYNRAELLITLKRFEEAGRGLRENLDIFKKADDNLTALYLRRMALAGDGKDDAREADEYKEILAGNPGLKLGSWSFDPIDKFLDREEGAGGIPASRLAKMRELTAEFKKHL